MGQQIWGRSPGMQEMLVLLLMPCVNMDKSLHFWLFWGTGAFPEGAQRVYSTLLLRLCAFLNTELDSYQNSSCRISLVWMALICSRS